ncbi:MAG: DUF2948 family protein [Chelatococcus sp.]|jgi:hypothetical protein|uniref:DUF2948 family protein n=1 Tax=unclassified Chelatococcus TaxID=2638111 RepID=UPI001BCAAC41|nr:MULTISPECIES: DUF2948 family protein [unclassified Chelatococcus]CAH1662317.1 conserved hypothetical protein [Hyphomicrobiales bacterium]MBS7741370.1 DUF2948 family protein [Chelatococcus sp. HY11]MBX3536885.1 DUF2948 family protein [Chelatococcus sp.]MBX3546148.1 DUF2948 family protein [Chelatococcus sp.]MCO5077203.1 DUF2948 family protein [Chelatococcus sp.]
MDEIKLIALDREDLSVISAHLQDALLRVEDLTYLPHRRCFAMAVHRFDWEAPAEGKPQRRLAALHFNQVERVRRNKIDPTSNGEVLNLLAIDFIETEAPSGLVLLLFSGGAAIELRVECIEAQLRDLGPAWDAPARPNHEPS